MDPRAIFTWWSWKNWPPWAVDEAKKNVFEAWEEFKPSFSTDVNAADDDFVPVYDTPSPMLLDELERYAASMPEPERRGFDELLY